MQSNAMIVDFIQGIKIYYALFFEDLDNLEQPFKSYKSKFHYLLDNVHHILYAYPYKGQAISKLDRILLGKNLIYAQFSFFYLIGRHSSMIGDVLAYNIVAKLQRMNLLREFFKNNIFRQKYFDLVNKSQKRQRGFYCSIKRYKEIRCKRSVI